ncbi:fumarylacetoacetate hydrolase family protein [Actinoplanes oblitus]|uniref:Fumarylacetoacetate hydrolase family protein n=1 Tax=Actinoplanes oblitus TaxID=3040509 RepID=A0ABY8WNT6_9ACTN|nr:fumarylacetoacetate hydrolase family protein [Actinoplanes oblitus]WIM98763.1 fumarylacetoacetate hydrolase family protein [Actinoplanes oblitus]
MRIVTYRHAGVERSGVVRDGTVFPFLDGRDVVQVIENGRPEVAEAGVPLADVRLLAPLKPRSVRDFVTFEEHVEGVRRSVDGAAGVPEAWYDAPTFYFTNPHTIYGPGDEIPFPAASAARDFELEVAAIAGPGQTIFGYTILNDFSARDLQSREMRIGLGPAKGKDFASSLGPWIVTADELAPYEKDGFLDLWCVAAVNGVEIGRDLLSNMGWTFPAMVAYAGRDSVVRAGDVLGSGTVGNGGCLAELWGRNGTQEPPPLRDGDEVTLTVEGIGTLTNRIVSSSTGAALPPVRRRDQARARSERQD